MKLRGLMLAAILVALPACARSQPVVISGQSNQIVSGQSFSNPTGDCLDISNSSNIIVENSTFNCGGSISIKVTGSSGVILRGNFISGGSVFFDGCTPGCQMVGNISKSAGPGNNAYTVNDTSVPSVGVVITGNQATDYGRIGIEVTSELSTIPVTNDVIDGNVLSTAQNPGGGFPWGISSVGGGNDVSHNQINIPSAQGNGIELIGVSAAANDNQIVGGSAGIIVNGAGNTSPGASARGNQITNPGLWGIVVFDNVTDGEFDANTITVNSTPAQIGIYENSNTGTARNQFRGNHIVMASTDAVDSIYGMVLSGPSTKVIGGTVVMTFLTRQSDQAAIRIGPAPPATTDLLVSDVTMTELSAHLGQGILAFGASADRWKIRNNPITGFNTCISLQTGTPIIADNELSNCTVDYAVNNGIPTTDTWHQGDFIPNLHPTELGSAGSKYTLSGWRAIAGGTPGIWRQARAATGN